MNSLATLYKLKQRLGLESDTEDTQLRAVLDSATAQIQRLTNRYFMPRVEAISHDMYSARELLLDDDLLELTALLNGDGSSIEVDDVLTLPNDGTPASVIILLRDLFTWEATALKAINVTGVWGWHDDWSSAWRASGDSVQDNPLSSSATTLTVTDADGIDSAQESPRFQVGHLLKIENEYLRVLAITINELADDTLTVQRGVNGTTVVAHAHDTAIEVYQPPADIELLVLRWATWLYKEPDSRTNGIPAGLLRDLDPLRRISVKG